ncbi:hypothetical protein CVT26_004903 [Gymnopilus dilepis]|uniref:Uncharacterized protein n=1 Tax=Gymnopilus dilepis TaxID=231916 RepID=A0A409YTB3_9AGAR|nr:hypothetical protein CVT26_004903 [Gymnopilus dilepis]
MVKVKQRKSIDRPARMKRRRRGILDAMGDSVVDTRSTTLSYAEVWQIVVLHQSKVTLEIMVCNDTDVEGGFRLSRAYLAGRNATQISELAGLGSDEAIALSAKGCIVLNSHCTFPLHSNTMSYHGDTNVPFSPRLLAHIFDALSRLTHQLTPVMESHQRTIDVAKEQDHCLCPKAEGTVLISSMIDVKTDNVGDSIAEDMGSEVNTHRPAGVPSQQEDEVLIRLQHLSSPCLIAPRETTTGLIRTKKRKMQMTMDGLPMGAQRSQSPVASPSQKRRREGGVHSGVNPCPLSRRREKKTQEQAELGFNLDDSTRRTLPANPVAKASKVAHRRLSTRALPVRLQSARWVPVKASVSFAPNR